MKDLKMTVLFNEPVNKAFYQIDLDAPQMEIPSPGQFVNVKVDGDSKVLLRRPLSIFDFKDGCLSLLYRVVGKGTKLLSERKQGEELQVLGPLGGAFPLCKGPVLLVAGGVGSVA